MAYTLYILYSSKKNRYYIGHNGEVLQERLRKHNSYHKGFTGGISDWIIVYTEIFSTNLKRTKEKEKLNRGKVVN